VQTFAQFFNGQVVDPDEEINRLLGEGPLRPSAAAANQPSHPDQDVPF
jgi:DNA polymerase-3 subunit gamma/tau